MQIESQLRKKSIVDQNLSRTTVIFDGWRISVAIVA